jgi:hypothetical protein
MLRRGAAPRPRGWGVVRMGQGSAWMVTFRKNLFVLVMIHALLTLLSCGMPISEAQRPNQLRLQPNRNCTWYVAPSGKRSSSGKERASPLALREAAKRTQPGDVVCFLPGTYDLDSPLYISTGGTAAAYVTYQSYDPANQARIRWRRSSGDDMFQVNSKAGYITVQELTFEGENMATAAIKCSRGSHHMRVIGNTINNAGQGGVSAVGCDYLTIDGNKIHHTGYGKGWGSGISLNKSIWHNRAAGFHSFVINNIISGSYDNSDFHSDGNGIIMDLGGNTPPVLIANNLIYQNGGRCIHIYENQNKWIINNTCYHNILDHQLKEETGVGVGEYSMIGSSNVYVINNTVYASINVYAFKQVESRRITYYHNTYYGGDGLSGVPSTVSSDPTQVRKADPLFVNPIALNPTADRQYRNAPHPDQIGTRFHVLPDSPLIDAGIDPRSVPGLTTELKAGIEKYLMKDLKGTPRPQGSGFDIGAYEYGDQAKRPRMTSVWRMPRASTA